MLRCPFSFDHVGMQRLNRSSRQSVVEPAYRTYSLLCNKEEASRAARVGENCGRGLSGPLGAGIVRDRSRVHASLPSTAEVVVAHVLAQNLKGICRPTTSSKLAWAKCPCRSCWNKPTWSGSVSMNGADNLLWRRMHSTATQHRYAQPSQYIKRSCLMSRAAAWYMSGGLSLRSASNPVGSMR